MTIAFQRERTDFLLIPCARLFQILLGLGFVTPIFAFPVQAQQISATIETSATLEDQAQALFVLGLVDQAEALYVHILEQRENTLGSEDEATLMAVLNLARFYREVDRRNEALPLFQRAERGLISILGTEHDTSRSVSFELDRLTGELWAIESNNAVVVGASGPTAARYQPGTRLERSHVFTLIRGDVVTIWTSGGNRRFAGPGRFPLSATQRVASITSGINTGSSGIARVGVGRGAPSTAHSGIPVYPVWPPETPTWQFSLDTIIGSRTDMSLRDVGTRLQRAFGQAGYLEHSFYAAPGGFAVVTRIEQMDDNGNRLRGSERFALPGTRTRDSLSSLLYSLFVNAPPGYYRYIVIVVSARPFATRNRLLDDEEALRRLRSGANSLTSVYSRVPFSDEYSVDALIYEFRWNGADGDVLMLEPGRVSPQDHLTRTGLARSVRRNFP